MGHLPTIILFRRADNFCQGLDNGMTIRVTRFGHKDGARLESVGHAAVLRQGKRPRIIATRERIERVQSDGRGAIKDERVWMKREKSP